MGLLQEQSIPTLFQGVSRQPDSIRYPGQVEDALNVSFSVENGGFSKRNGTTVVTEVASAPAAFHKMHLISRSTDEKYAIIHFQQGNGTGELKIFDTATGAEKALTFADPEDTTFFDTYPGDMEFLSVVDYTFVINKTLTVEMLPAPTPDPNVYSAVQLTQANTDGTYTIAVTWEENGDTHRLTALRSVNDGSVEPDDMISSIDNCSWIYRINDVIQTSGSNNDGLGGALQAGLNSLANSFSSDFRGSFVFIKNSSGVSFAVETSDPLGDGGFKVTSRRVSSPNDLVSRAYNGHYVEIRKSTEVEGYWLKFVTDDPNASYGPGTWDETVPPGTQISFDPATMPRALVRQTDGSFRLERIEWDEKKAGGDDLVPVPDFVGGQISDIVFRANRLGFLSGETVYFSASGDYFRFWPDSATGLVATDPFGLTNSTNQVSAFTFGVPFRRSLFIMSDEAQFEAYGDVFSPEDARLEVATQYPANANVRPVVVGDEMYFVSEIGRDVMLYSYVYNDDTVSEVANDVSRHVRGFVKGPVKQIAAGVLNGELFILSSADQSTVYVHKFYYEGRERIQSSWTRYSFENANVHSIGYLVGKLYLLIERNDGRLYLETLPSVEATTVEFEVSPRLDRQKHVLGVYDSNTGLTTWDVGMVYDNPVVLTTLLFPEGKKFLNLSVTQEGPILTAVGDWSDAECVVGEEYPAYVELSKQFLRQGDQAIVNGRLQMRTMTLRYERTGYFEVEVLPEYRDVKNYVFTGRILGLGSNQIQAFNLSSGRFRFLVNSNAETVRVKIGSDKFLPFTITSGAWIGFFNEISRQDNG